MNIITLNHPQTCVFPNYSGVTLTKNYLCCLPVNHSGDQELGQMQKKTNNINTATNWQLAGEVSGPYAHKTVCRANPKSHCTINAIIVCLPVFNLPCRAFAKIWQRNSKTIRKTWRVKLWTMTKLQTTEREIKQSYNCIYERLSILLPLCLPYCKSHCKVWPTNKSQPPLPKGRVHDTLPNTWFTQW